MVLINEPSYQGSAEGTSFVAILWVLPILSLIENLSPISLQPTTPHRWALPAHTWATLSATIQCPESLSVLFPSLCVLQPHTVSSVMFYLALHSENYLTTAHVLPCSFQMQYFNPPQTHTPKVLEGGEALLLQS